MVRRPLNSAISYREAGVTIDLFLFSTHTNLMEFYSQTDLDGIFINNAGPKLDTSLAANKIVISWPTSATDYALESTTSLSPPNWTPVTTPPVVNGEQTSVTIDVVVGGNAYYRLKHKQP
jgi:hypothetical protein